jgi:hypothetical protein
VAVYVPTASVLARLLPRAPGGRDRT